jgi:cysteine synthase
VQSKAAKVVKMVEEVGPGRTVATVALDTGLKYLAGDLYET